MVDAYQEIIDAVKEMLGVEVSLTRPTYMAEGAAVPILLYSVHRLEFDNPSYNKRPGIDAGLRRIPSLEAAAVFFYHHLAIDQDQVNIAAMRSDLAEWRREVT